MYAALGFKFFIVPLAITGVIVYLFILVSYHQIYPNDYSVMSFIKPIGFTVTIVGAFAFIASRRSVFWGIMSLLERVGVRIFPDINGTWGGKLISNVDMVLQLIESAAGREAPINVGSRKAELREDSITLTIKASFFKIVFTARSGRSEIVSLKVIPEPARDGHPDRLYVMYMTHVVNPDPGHPRDYHGAAIINVKRRKGDIVLHGRYWTDSQWHQGLAEAGYIRDIRRIQDGRDRALPEATKP